MSTRKVLQELLRKKQCIEEAIRALERLDRLEVEKPVDKDSKIVPFRRREGNS